MKTELQSDGTIMPRSSAAIGCAVATFDSGYVDISLLSGHESEVDKMMSI